MFAPFVRNAVTFCLAASRATVCNYSMACLAQLRQVRYHSHIFLQHTLLPRGLVLAHYPSLVHLSTENSSQGPQILVDSKAKYLLHLERNKPLPPFQGLQSHF